MASEVSICNSALRKLGQGRIVSLTEDSTNARAMNACYVDLRDAELEAHPWGCARKRATLSPDTAEPNDTYSYQYTLPADCLRILKPTDVYLDWQIEGGRILTNTGTTIDLPYVFRLTDPNAMPSTLREAIACRIAAENCELLTQSTTKLQAIADMRKQALAEARSTNAFQQVSADPPMDRWIYARL